MNATNWFSEPLTALADAGVDFVVVGGLATIAHGYRRTTEDVDVVLHLEPTNVRLAMATLRQVGYNPKAPVPAADFADPDKRREWITTKHMVVFSMFHPDGNRPLLDIFVDYPLPWQEMRQQARPLAVGEATVPVCSLDHLIQMKRQAGRAKDRADLEKLELFKATLAAAGQEQL